MSSVDPYYIPIFEPENDSIEWLIRCAFDGYYYPSAFMKEVEEGIFVFNRNLENYKLKNNID